MGKSSTVRVDRPPVSSKSTYTAIPFGHKIRSQRAAVVKTYAAVVRSSWVDPDDQRITRSTDRHLAELSASDPETIARHLAELEEAGVITIQGEGRRLIVIHDQAVGVGDWRINLFDDHPAWALSPRAFKVYLGIRKFAGKKTSCNPTDQTLAKLLAMSVDSVNRGMAELRKCMGIVTTCSPFDRDRRTKSRTIHLAQAERWIITKPVDPTPDPKSASLNTSMGADFGFDDRPERVDRIRNSAPEQSEICTPTIRNLHSNNPKSAPIEVLIEDENKPKPNPNPLPSELSGQSESEPERVEVVVGLGSVPPQGTDPKTDPADDLIRRYRDRIEASPLNAIERTDFRKALRKLIADHGPIPGQWIEAALAVKATKGTFSLGKVAIKNLRRWTELTADEQAAIPDCPEVIHREFWADRIKDQNDDSPKIIRSKFDGQKRVQRADGTWANKALPAENGSGALAHNIVAERESRWAAQRAADERMRQERLAKLDQDEIKRRNEETLRNCEKRIEDTKRQLGLYGMGDITCESEKFERTSDAIKRVSLDMAPEEYRSALKGIFIEAFPFWEELKKREHDEHLRLLAKQREQERIESQRVEIEKEVRETVNLRISAWSLIRQKELKEKGVDANTVFQRIREEWPVEKERFEAAVRAEFAPKFADLAPTPPPTRKPPGPPPGPPATIPAMVSR